MVATREQQQWPESDSGANRNTYRIIFRWEGKRYEFSTDLEDEDRARAKARDVEEFRKLVLRKSIPIPDNVVDVPRWIVTGGREGFKQNCRQRPAGDD